MSEIVDDKYLIWLFKGAYYKDNNGEWHNKLCKEDTIRIIAENILLDKGLVVEYNDKIVTIERAEELKKLTELNANSNFIKAIGDKVELKVTVEKITYFDGVYGTTWITTMRTEEGDVVVYKGKCLDKVVLYKDLLTDTIFKSNDSKFWKNLVHIGVESGRWRFILITGKKCMRTSKK